MAPLDAAHTVNNEIYDCGPPCNGCTLTHIFPQSNLTAMVGFVQVFVSRH